MTDADDIKLIVKNNSWQHSIPDIEIQVKRPELVNFMWELHSPTCHRLPYIFLPLDMQAGSCSLVSERVVLPTGMGCYHIAEKTCFFFSTFFSGATVVVRY